MIFKLWDMFFGMIMHDDDDDDDDHAKWFFFFAWLER